MEATPDFIAGPTFHRVVSGTTRLPEARKPPTGIRWPASTSGYGERRFRGFGDLGIGEEK